jgi:hypothetical protein
MHIQIKKGGKDMQHLTTLGEVSNRVDQLSQECHDKLIPVADVSFDDFDTVRIAGEPHKLRRMAQQGFSYRLGIPIQYLKKSPADVQAYNLNHWIKEEKNEKLLFRFDDGEVRVIFSPRYTPVDNFEVLERLDTLGYGPDTPVQCSMDDEFMGLNIPDGKKTFSINGDKMQPGLSISNSEVGLASLTVAAFVLRIVCTNGMISSKEVSASYRHVSRKILEEFPEVLDKVSYELGKAKDQFKLSLASPVNDPQATITSFNRQFQLGKLEQEAVEWAWPQEIGETMFHVVNTYTKSAQYDGLSAESTHKLQRTGGAILAMLK